LYLREKLKEVNSQLPAAVYIPFLSQSMRNYAVLHIVTEESRIFRTKMRAPLLLCLEVYRPIEMTLQKKPTFVEVND
jgi:phosphatidylinositol 4-kinase